jgi:transcription termination factor NusA
VVELLYQAGFKSAEEIAESELEEILDVEGVSKEKAEALHKSAKEFVVEKKRKEEEAAKAAAEAAAQAAAEAAAADSAESTEPVAVAEEKTPQT